MNFPDVALFSIPFFIGFMVAEIMGNNFKGKENTSDQIKADHAS